MVMGLVGSFAVGNSSVYVTPLGSMRRVLYSLGAFRCQIQILKERQRSTNNYFVNLGKPKGVG